MLVTPPFMSTQDRPASSLKRKHGVLESCGFELNKRRRYQPQHDTVPSTSSQPSWPPTSTTQTVPSFAAHQHVEQHLQQQPLHQHQHIEAPFQQPSFVSQLHPPLYQPAQQHQQPAQFPSMATTPTPTTTTTTTVPPSYQHPTFYQQQYQRQQHNYQQQQQTQQQTRPHHYEPTQQPPQTAPRMTGHKRKRSEGDMEPLYKRVRDSADAAVPQSTIHLPDDLFENSDLSQQQQLALRQPQHLQGSVSRAALVDVLARPYGDTYYHLVREDKLARQQNETIAQSTAIIPYTGSPIHQSYIKYAKQRKQEEKKWKDSLQEAQCHSRVTILDSTDNDEMEL